MVELPTAQRAAILKRYLDVAPGARPHVSVEPTAPAAEFAAIAGAHPVFRVEGFAPTG